MNELIARQFATLQASYPSSAIVEKGDGSYHLILKEIPLPEGWTKQSVEIRFIIPVGYPMARPDCFWTDLDLRLANSAMPVNANPSPMPPDNVTYLWFSWHLQTWNPNSDSLVTYVNVIRRRLQEVK